MNQILFAKLVRREKTIYSDLTIAEIVVWKLPSKTKERHTGISTDLTIAIVMEKLL